MFTCPGASPLHHSNFRVRVWLPALKAAGLTGLHFHDLRHTGNTLAATAGATLRELMDRMGHDSERAAMIYLHGSDAPARDRGHAEQTHPGRAEKTQEGSGREDIGHATGTRPEKRFLKIDCLGPEHTL